MYLVIRKLPTVGEKQILMNYDSNMILYIERSAIADKIDVKFSYNDQDPAATDSFSIIPLTLDRNSHYTLTFTHIKQTIHIYANSLNGGPLLGGLSKLDYIRKKLF